MNIEQKSTLFIITLISTVMLSMASIALVLISDHVDEESGEKLDKAFKASSEQFRNERKEMLLSSQYIVSQGVITTQDKRKQLQTELKKARNSFGSDLVVFVGHEGGNYYISGDSSYATLLSNAAKSSGIYQRLHQQVLDKKIQISGIIRILGNVMNYVAIPVVDVKGQQQGILIQGRLINDSVIGHLKQIHAVDILLYSNKNVYENSRPSFAYLVENFTRGHSPGKTKLIKDGNKKFYIKSYLLNSDSKHKPVYILLSVSADAEIESYLVLFKSAIYAGVLVMLLCALIAIQLIRLRLTKPMKLLAKTARLIGGGDLSNEIADKGRRDELGDLSVSLEQMRLNILQMQSKEEMIRDRMSDYVRISSDWLWETDENGVFSYLSKSASDSLGFSIKQLLGKKMTDVFVQDNLIELSKYFGSGDDSGKGFRNLEYWITTKQGYRVCIRFSATPYFSNSVFQGYRGTASDVTKSKSDEERLIRLANKDHLTGLSNRKRFMEDLDREINLAKRQKTKGAVLLIDLDHFKLINDTAGHAAGDEVIVQLAGQLRKLTRNVDLSARLSGDEFVLAFVNTDISQLQKRVDEIINKINQLKPMYSGKVMNLSASIGVAIYPDHACTPAEVLARADAAMYMAKSGGRNRAHIYTPDDHQQEKMGSQLIWKDRIHDALENQKLVLAFQPIQPTTGETASRYEVLIRMRKSDGDLYYPGDFIPTAEQFGLIRDIDAWVVKRAISVLSDLPPEHSHISFTINLSGLSVGEVSMYELISGELDKLSLDRSRIIFEVTESAAFQDINKAIEFIEKIKYLGCRIALDDFGVGFSSFSYLKQLHADILKIDGSFIRDIHQNKDDQLFVKALVDVARGMGMITVAEFVESEQIYQMVRSLGVDYVQGYHIGRPEVGLFG